MSKDHGPSNGQFEFKDDPVAIDAIGQRCRSTAVVAVIEMHDSMRYAAREIERLRARVRELESPPVETTGRLWTQAEWDLKNKQVDELEQEARQLRIFLRRFMNCRSEPPGTGWKVAAGANAGDALNKVYLDAKKHFAGSPLEPAPAETTAVNSNVAMMLALWIRNWFKHVPESAAEEIQGIIRVLTPEEPEAPIVCTKCKSTGRVEGATHMLCGGVFRRAVKATGSEDKT